MQGNENIEALDPLERVDAPESFKTPLLRYGLVLCRTDLKDACDTLVAIEAISLFGMDCLRDTLPGDA